MPQCSLSSFHFMLPTQNCWFFGIESIFQNSAFINYSSCSHEAFVLYGHVRKGFKPKNWDFKLGHTLWTGYRKRARKTCARCNDCLWSENTPFQRAIVSWVLQIQSIANSLPFFALQAFLKAEILGAEIGFRSRTRMYAPQRCQKVLRLGVIFTDIRVRAGCFA